MTNHIPSQSPAIANTGWSFPKGVIKVTKPKMSNHRGRTWDRCTVILPDGREIDGHLDTTWGTRVYFVHGDRWHAVPVHMYDAGNSMALVCDLRLEPRD